MTRGILSILLLTCSNVFMTTAWYLHLKQKEAWSMLLAIGISWLIALPEYCLQVPANRLGHVSGGGPFTAPQLKVLQEAITLVVFGVFSVVVLKEKLRHADMVAFALIFAGVLVSMVGKK
ncbi:MAG TPA: DMT family protein [Phycisphaerales bacterium]|nr:DMT family protein [Phycisphaerales bacterium]